MRSLSRDADDTINYNCIINTGFIGFSATQMYLSNSNCKIIKILKFLNINFKNNDNEFFGLPYGCRNDVATKQYLP